MLDSYAVYAIKYAERAGSRAEHFLGGDSHDSSMPMDYFVWVLAGPESVWIVDTGFQETDAQERGRCLVRSVPDALRLVGVEADLVENVVLTHLHYDHAGGLDHFPAARFHVQEREVAYATGRWMCHDLIRHSYTASHISGLIHETYAGRVVFHDGDAVLAPGLSVHLVGGHTMGLQIVRVWTEAGWMVLASDAAHFYENLEMHRPFPVLHDVGAVLDGYRTARELVARPDLVIPGHDPRVFERFPSARIDLDGGAVQLSP